MLKKKSFQSKYLAHQKHLFRQFNKEKLEGDFLIIHLNPDYPYQVHKMKYPEDVNVGNMINEKKPAFVQDIPGNTQF